MQMTNFFITRKAESELYKTQTYVLKNTIPAKDGRKCVDGRYLPSQGCGMIARPGGDCGYVMALMAVNRKKKLGLSPEACFNAVYKVVSDGRNHHFCMHTDHHCDPDNLNHKGLIGCGHITKASMNELANGYDLDSQEVSRFVSYARNIADITPKMKMVSLGGDHGESGILVVHSKKYTVNAWDPEVKRMYFVYDIDRDMTFLERIVKRMAIPDVNFAEMKYESDLQLKATLHNLAKDLPIYSISFSHGVPEVKFESFVE